MLVKEKDVVCNLFMVDFITFIVKLCTNEVAIIVLHEVSDALSKLQTVTLFQPIRSLQCS